MGFKDRDLVIASKTADLASPVYGQIVGFYEDQESFADAQQRTGLAYPSMDDMQKFTVYTVSYFVADSLIPSFMMTPFVVSRQSAQSLAVPDGFIRVAEYPLDTAVIVSTEVDFADAVSGVLVYQDVTQDGGHNIFGVSHFSESLGCETVTYGKFAKLIVIENAAEAVSKSQLLGLITQLVNLINNGNDTAKAMRSVANLYSKPDEVLSELAALKGLIQHHG